MKTVILEHEEKHDVLRDINEYLGLKTAKWLLRRHRAFRNTAAPINATTNTTARELSSTNCILHPFGSERTITQLSSASNSTGESQASLPAFDSLEENDFFYDSPASSFSEAMSPATRRSTTDAAARTGLGHASKRRRTTTAIAPATPPRPTSRQTKSSATRKDMDELFSTNTTHSPIDVEAKPDYDIIDLTETKEESRSVESARPIQCPDVIGNRLRRRTS
ncbi:uncharacterized protein FFNC_15539 [Fusarium fujikuroi]|nr:uncharacterized protein FFNC_15539 [Fusarium fujikuroi]